MSMLAEPKRKKKWSLNPRGKLWSNDDSKLGQKLLEKMGWSKGKGLGREEQGDLEPVRLKYKKDAEGVGYVGKDDQWIAHHEEFNAILGKLNGSDEPAPVPETVPIKSLEVRSKVSKARVHYHKFTRGKDLSRYSESDLASILGKRASNSNPSSDDEKETELKPEVKEEVVEKVEAKEEVGESTADREHSHGVTTINKGNIHEYFAAKMAALKAKNQAAHPTGNTPEQTSQDNANAEKRVRINEDLNQVKEFCSKKRITEWSQETLAKSTESSDSETEKKKEKSKKKKSKSAETGEAVIIDCDANQEDVEPPKPKKRKLEQEVGEQELEQTAPKKKKKKDKDNQENCPPVQTNDEAHAEVNQSQKKKKCTDDDAPDETNEIKKSKKKKKKDKSDEDAEITQQTEAAEPSETGEPAKKKKKKNKSEADAGSTIAANQSDHPEVAETEPKKMKKKRSQFEDEDSCVAASSAATSSAATSSAATSSAAASSDDATSAPDAQNQEMSGEKKKKKKKKGKKEVNEDSMPDSKAASNSETQSDRLAETNDPPGAVEQGNAQKTDNVVPSDPSGAQNNYPVPDFSFIEKPSKVKESIVKYQKASFEMFKGSNLFSLAGYGNSS